MECPRARPRSAPWAAKTPRNARASGPSGAGAPRTARGSSGTRIRLRRTATPATAPSLTAPRWWASARRTCANSRRRTATQCSANSRRSTTSTNHLQYGARWVTCSTGGSAPVQSNSQMPSRTVSRQPISRRRKRRKPSRARTTARASLRHGAPVTRRPAHKNGSIESSCPSPAPTMCASSLTARNRRESAPSAPKRPPPKTAKAAGHLGLAVRLTARKSASTPSLVPPRMAARPAP
mmetsp:Transcript_39934/g.99933  ORF Transcript_39934/g.99933 Transcript_39934/m.99933 type:complete len:237 (+) Transcript_39934:504-1214(+)